MVRRLLAGAGFVVFWSCGFLGARWGTQYTNAFDLLAWRFLLAGALAAVVLLIRRPKVSRRDLITQLAMAFAVSPQNMRLPRLLP